MTIVAHYHAVLREKIGCSSGPLDIEEPATAAGVLNALGARYPDLAPLIPALKLAVNDELADSARALSPSDRVDVFPPFGGG